ncbi:hypothetical protein ACFQE0_14655 [Methylobacterium komagatae]|uniref:Uncharacterized protein n=1 Tax=Methylobacterium komagatae TaxID=374425 RepID=A0ABW2BL57_9HYPH
MAEHGIHLYERDASGNRELFLAAPAETLVPACAVPGLLILARPRLRWPKRLSGNPKIGRLKRVRPPELQAARDDRPANLSHRVRFERRIPVGDAIEDYYPQVIPDGLWKGAR